MIKSLLFSSLLAFSSGSSLTAVNKAPFIPLNANDYENYPNVFYNVGGSPYSITNSGVIVGQSYSQSFYRMNLIIGSVDEELDGVLKPNIYVGFSFENEYMYFRRNIIDNNDYEFTNKDFFNILELNISFLLDSPYEVLWINLSGHRVINSLVVPYDFDLRFDWDAPFDYSEQLPYPYFNYFESVNFKFYNNILLSSFDDVFESGKRVGFDEGFANGFNDGMQTGYDEGYNIGFNEGLLSDFNTYSWLTGIFSAMGGLLSIQLLPNVSLGGILILILVLTLLPFLIGLLKGGKG